MSKKILYVVNCPSFFLSHRVEIAKKAIDDGFEVHVATGAGSGIDEIKQYGFEYHQTPLSRSGKNILLELQSIFFLCSEGSQGSSCGCCCYFWDRVCIPVKGCYGRDL